jgi:hypothetical protein
MGYALFSETIPDSKEWVKEASSTKRHSSDIMKCFMIKQT